MAPKANSAARLMHVLATPDKPKISLPHAKRPKDTASRKYSETMDRLHTNLDVAVEAAECGDIDLADFSED